MKSKHGKRFRQHLYTVFFRFTLLFAGCRVYNDKATHVPKTSPGIEQIQCWINQSTRIEVLKVRTSARNIRWRTLHEPVHWHILTTKSNSHRISCISTSWPGCMVHIMFLNMYRLEWYSRQAEQFALWFAKFDYERFLKNWFLWYRSIACLGIFRVPAYERSFIQWLDYVVSIEIN